MSAPAETSNMTRLQRPRDITASSPLLLTTVADVVAFPAFHCPAALFLP